VFKNQIKSLPAQRAYVTVARHRRRPAVPLDRDSISCVTEGCPLAKWPTAGLTNPGTARANMSSLQLLPYGSHRLFWMDLVLEQGQFTILYGIYPSSKPQSSLLLRLQCQAQCRTPRCLLQMDQLMSPPI